MIRPASEQDFLQLIHLWERSVRATHDFLPEDYLQEIKGLLPTIFPAIPIYLQQNESGVIIGFVAVADHKIEMLFIDPGNRGQGIGRALTTYAIHQLKADKVDVNEQNQQAVGFYERMGFIITGRTEKDGLGRPFPLLQMTLRT